jgi:hypothetical protein
MAFIRGHFVQSHNPLMDDEGKIQVINKEWCMSYWELKKEKMIKWKDE